MEDYCNELFVYPHLKKSYIEALTSNVILCGDG